MSSFKVNGKELPVMPSRANITYYDLDGDSQRNANGILIRQVIRRNVIKLELEFPPMKSDELKELLKIFDSPEFNFTFPDPETYLEKTIRAYTGDRSMEYMRIDVDRVSIPNTYPVQYKNVNLYSGVKFSIIEY